LEQYGASAISLAPDDRREDPHITTTEASLADVTVLGIAVKGWNITTWQGTIANEEWLEQMIYQCEASAQPQPQQSSSSCHRKLNLPEMVFGVAHVTLEQQHEPLPNHNDDDAIRRHHAATLHLGWDTEQALMEWARAHASIPLESTGNKATTAPATMETNVNLNDDHEPTKQTRPDKQEDDDTGVTILQSMDAALWNSKRLMQPLPQIDPNIATTASSWSNSSQSSSSSSLSLNAAPTVIVQYDWTYSTPYSGHVKVLSQRVDDSTDIVATPEHQLEAVDQEQHQQQRRNVIWKSLSTSGIKLELLTDQSVPILYYDEIILLEDDLHDNGQVQYSVKLRVMPHCVYILARLFLRVDQVMLRLRETRVLLELDHHNSDDTTRRTFPKIHRDVTWRQCAWKDLPKYSLPTAVSAWCGNGSSGMNRGTTSQDVAGLVESPEFRARLAQLPLQPALPFNLCPHAVLVEEGQSQQQQQQHEEVDYQ
jgi:hypothetical protein